MVSRRLERRETREKNLITVNNGFKEGRKKKKRGRLAGLCRESFVNVSVIKSIVERASEERIDGGNQPKLSRLPKEGRKKGGFGLVCFWAEKRKKENGRARENITGLDDDQNRFPER